MLRWPLLAAYLCLTGCAGWTPIQKGLLATYETCTVADALQTHSALQTGRFHEVNPVLGSKPSNEKLIGATVVRVGASGYLAYKLRPEQRIPVFGAIDVIACGVVVRNHMIGARINF